MHGFDLSGWHFVVIAIAIYLGITLYTNGLDLQSLGAFNISLQIGTLTIFIIQLMLALDNYRQQLVDRHKAFYLKYANLAQMKLNDIDKMFFGNPLLDRLYYQMYSGDPHIELAKKLKHSEMKINNITVKRNVDHINSSYNGNSADLIKAEHHASSIIFQTMADIYMSGLADRDGKFYCEDLIEWWITFRKWMRSPILQSHWNTLHSEHHPKFQQFMNDILKSVVN